MAQDDRPILRAGADATIAAAGALIASFAPELGPVLAGTVEAGQHVGQRLIDRSVEHRRAALQEMTQAACAQANVDLAELVGAVVADERKLQAFTSATEAAFRTAVRVKMRALGRSVGRLAVDEALIDPEAVWIDVFAKVERPHVRVLLAIREQWNNIHHPAFQVVSRASVGAATGLGELVLPMLETLQQVGLIGQDPSVGGLSFGPDAPFSGRLQLGPLAAEFFDRLEDAGGTAEFDD